MSNALMVALLTGQQQDGPLSPSGSAGNDTRVHLCRPAICGGWPGPRVEIGDLKRDVPRPPEQGVIRRC